MTPIIRGNSFYRVVDGIYWSTAQQNAKNDGGDLVTINSESENAFLVDKFKVDGNGYWIGFTDQQIEGEWQWISGQPVTYTNWIPGRPDNYNGNQHFAVLWWGNDLQWEDAAGPDVAGIEEVPITASIQFSAPLKEGAGIFTTSITLSAGTEASGNLTEGATVYWEVTGVSAEDLASGSLSGSGVVTNGKLDVFHSLKSDSSIEYETLQVLVYSDASKTTEYQIGSGKTATVIDSTPTPVIRANSLYAIVDGPSWNQAEAKAVVLGGHLVEINSQSENAFLYASYVGLGRSDLSRNARNQIQDLTFALWIGGTDREAEGNWVNPSGIGLTYTNWGTSEPSNVTWYDVNGEDFASIVFTDPAYSGVTGSTIPGSWNDLGLTPPNSDHAFTGIAELALSLSITLPQSLKEDGGLFKTSINLSAGTETSGNLAEGATVYWKITSIQADDLASGTLTGSGVITEGKLDLQHSLVADADTGEKFEISVFSDSLMTQQIGTTASATVQESDVVSPTITGIAVQGTTVVLNCSEAVSATSVPTKAFSVATVNTAGRATPRTIDSVALDQNDPSKVILTLQGVAPASNVNLRVSYTDPANDQTSGVVQDLADNDLASFPNRFADTFIASSTSTIASQYRNLTLSGSTAINGTGNALANTLTGNTANNTLSGLAGSDDLKGDAGNDILIGGASGDLLTGGAGSDTFRFALTDSLLASMDRITDLVIGTDIIDGPRAVTAANLRELGTVTALTQAGIAAVLTTAIFVANGAATFSFGTGATARTFLALNNGTAGFSSTTDAVIEITGFSEELTSFAVV